MSVYKPQNSPYFHFDFVWKGNRFHGSTGCRSRRDALAYENRERQKAALPDRERPPITLDEACGLYEEKVGHKPSWPTISYMLAAMIDGLGSSKLLSEVTQRDLSTYFARRRAGRTNASVNREIENCRAVWRWAGRNRFDVGEMPEWGALLLEVPKKDPRELSAAEELALFPEIRADLYDFCDFALKAGWRMSEVLGLRWVDCDLNAAVAETRIKGGDVVKRPLTQSMVVLIANQPKVGPFVFTYVCQKNKSRYVDRKGRAQPARKKGERYPMTKTVLRKPWAAAKKAAKVEGFRFHDLRHTTGTRILRATGNLAAAKEALKHKHIKTTLRYAHAADDDVRKALDAATSRTIPEATVEQKQKA